MKAKFACCLMATSLLIFFQTNAIARSTTNTNLKSKRVTRTSNPNLNSKVPGWNLIAFIEATPDLKPYAEQDLAAIRDEASRQGINSPEILIQYDNLEKNSFQRFDLQSSASASEPVQLTQNDPDRRLDDFLGWAMPRAKNEKTILVLWGHGRGWSLMSRLHALDVFSVDNFVPLASLKTADRPRFLLPQSLDSTFVNMDDFLESLNTSQLGQVVAKHAQGAGRPFDVVAFDACLMQTAEVSDEFADSAAYIVGSEQIFPYSGLPYRQLVDSLAASASADERLQPKTLAFLLPEMTKRFHQGANDDGWLTLSAIDVRALHDELAPALHEFGSLINHTIASDNLKAAIVQNALRQTPRFLGDYKDISWWIAKLKDEDRSLSFASSETKVLNALSDTVLSSIQGSRYSSPLGGISVWLPETQDELELRRDAFRRSKFYSQVNFAGTPSPWESWLDTLYGVKP
jgi:hypothetical protein